MATKNKITNFESLFSAYRESLSNEIETKKKEVLSKIKDTEKALTDLETEIKEIDAFLKNVEKPAHLIDTRKSQECEQKIKKEQRALENLKNLLLTTEQRENIDKTIKAYKKLFDDKNNEINSLTQQIDDPSTPATKLPSLKGQRTKLKNSLTQLQENIKQLKQQIEEDDKKIEQLKLLEEKINTLQAQYNAILKDEKKFARQQRSKFDNIDAEILAKKQRKGQIPAEKKKIKEEIDKLEKELASIPITTVAELSSFENFLKYNNFSTVHAKDLFEMYNNANHKIKISKDDFKLRKQHPKRDKFLKKFLTPALLTGAAVGVASGLIASSGLIAGSKWLFITITSNPAVNFLSAALPGAAIGVVATIATLKLKDVFTKLHYKSKYGNPDKVLSQGENSAIYDLIAKIKNTKQDILDLRTSKRVITRTFKNIVNRNRIHHLEYITEALIERFNKISNNQNLDISTKIESLTPIYETLTKINKFYTEDIQQSKFYALVTCDDNQKHKHTIENLDIYAKLSMYLESVSNKVKTSNSIKKKAHTVAKSDIRTQNIVAEKLLNEDIEVTGLVMKRYLELVKASNLNKTPEARAIDSYIVSNGSLNITYKDGKTISYQVENADKIKKVESVNLGKTLLITYKNGEQKTISSTVKTTKINLDMPGEFDILERLKSVAVIEYLIEQKGFSRETIDQFKEALKATKFNKNGKEKTKPTLFMKTTAFKTNPEYAKIMKEVNLIVKNPKIVEIDFGFNA